MDCDARGAHHTPTLSWSLLMPQGTRHLGDTWRSNTHRHVFPGLGGCHSLTLTSADFIVREAHRRPRMPFGCPAWGKRSAHSHRAPTGELMDRGRRRSPIGVGPGHRLDLRRKRLERGTATGSLRTPIRSPLKQCRGFSGVGGCYLGNSQPGEVNLPHRVVVERCGTIRCEWRQLWRRRSAIPALR